MKKRAAAALVIITVILLQLQIWGLKIEIQKLWKTIEKVVYVMELTVDNTTGLIEMKSEVTE